MENEELEVNGPSEEAPSTAQPQGAFSPEWSADGEIPGDAQAAAQASAAVEAAMSGQTVEAAAAEPSAEPIEEMVDEPGTVEVEVPVAQPTLFEDVQLKPAGGEPVESIERPEPLFPFAVLADWSMVLICVGLALVCACVIIPQADANRRLVYEREKLQRDLNQIHKQLAVNEEFLHRVDDDPQLAERLALRQMKMITRGTATLDLNPAHGGPDGAGAAAASDSAQQVSPFVIVNVPPPPALPPYRPLGGMLSALCLNAQSQLLLMGGAMLLVAIGLVLGPGAKPAAKPEV